MQFKYLFTVIIPTYNCGQYIPKALDSLLLQGEYFTKTQVLIVNDGSTDNTKQIVEPYTQQYSNIEYLEKPNGNWGSVVNFVKQNQLAKGQYITVLDSDDYFLANAFQRVAAHFGHDMIVSAFYCYISPKRRCFLKPYFGKTGVIEQKTKLRTPHSQPLAKFYRHEIFHLLDPLKEKLFYQDCLLYHNAINKVQSVFYICEPLAVWYATRPGNSTTMPWNNADKFQAWCDLLKQMNLYGAGIVIYIYTMLPGFLKELKRQQLVLDLAKKPAYTWLPQPLAFLFGGLMALRTRKYIRYPKN
ncbi:glycosyltransferase family 2 protein [Mycoplasmoides pneumoniae]|uniref:glycosyltransferase family 2 protein n=1 Tax=Mycoplasmoides pneumoniae TaxID=2104 RepID=UPI00071B7394|nr:glycosyltransferase family 2 protein [Mycoplasmoides pneumoniae]